MEGAVLPNMLCYATFYVFIRRARGVNFLLPLEPSEGWQIESSQIKSNQTNQINLTKRLLVLLSY